MSKTGREGQDPKELSSSYAEFEREFLSSSAFLQLRHSSDWSVVSCIFSDNSDNVTLTITIASAPSLLFKWTLSRAPITDSSWKRRFDDWVVVPKHQRKDEVGVPTMWTVDSIRATADGSHGSRPLVY